MHYSTVFVGIDAHKEKFSLASYTNEDEIAKYPRNVDAHHSKVISYIESLRFHYGDDVQFICGYEAGCLGYTLYHDLTAHNVKCVIMAPTTMAVAKGRKRIKTDKRDAAMIAQCLAHHEYRAVHVPTKNDEQVKEYIRMRDDHKLALKKVKQQILAFCLRHGIRYDGTKNHWTQTHIFWLHSLKLEGLYAETLEEYLIEFEYLVGKIQRIDERIEELAEDEEYRDKVRKLKCFIGIKTQTALSVIVETGDFNRFADAQQYSSFIGLVPGENSSGGDQKRLGITKAGNSHVRTLLIEAAQCYSRGPVGRKSRLITARQNGNPPAVIAYADKANDRLRRRYHRLVLKNGKNTNVAKAAIARELACYIWGMMTDNIA